MRWSYLLACSALVLAACRDDGKPLPKQEEVQPALKAHEFIDSTVYFEKLRQFLPRELKGYAQIRDEGSTGKYGEVVVSEAERVFEHQSHQVSVRIVDTTIAERLGKAIKAAAQDALDHEADDPGAPLKVENAVGFVRFDETEDKAEANLLVGGRFVVAVTTEGFADTREVRRLAGELDLAGLSKLR